MCLYLNISHNYKKINELNINVTNKLTLMIINYINNILIKILVTGGLGFIGSHTVVELINKGYEVIIIDSLVNSNIKVLDNIEKITGKRPEFHKIDLLNQNFH